MAEYIRMPKMSDTMTEGVIAAWHKKEGDKVQSGDILAEVETDKATMELEAYEDGTLLYIGPKEKDAVEIDGVIAIIGEKGEDISDMLKEIENGGSSNGNGQEEQKEETSDAGSDDGGSEEIDTSNINANVILMPKMSDTMTEGTIVSWQKKVGDSVKSGDILAEVETDKATMELEAYEDGTLLYVAVEEGNAVPVDDVIAIVGEKGADYETLLKAAKNNKKSSDEPKKEEAPKASSSNGSDAPAKNGAAQKVSAPAPVDSSGDGRRVKASPLAKKLAEDKGFDIARIPGSGEGGRIIKKDVENYIPQTGAAAAGAEGGAIIPSVVGEEKYTEQPVSQMRKTIARRLSESKFTAPHFYVTMEINMDKAIEARKSINEIAPVKVSFNDMVIKAVAASLRRHPAVNSAWMGDSIRQNDHIHIGVAVAIDDGLVVPVVRFADGKSLSHIGTEVKELAKKAKEKTLQPSEWEGNTFTISNLGMFGVEEFTAIINPPDSCILAVGGIKQTAVVKDGQLVPGNVMKVTLSCDHRVVDGALGAAFLKTLKEMLEDPVRILV